VLVPFKRKRHYSQNVSWLGGKKVLEGSRNFAIFIDKKNPAGTDW
jgi:hypothetical protein